MQCGGAGSIPYFRSPSPPAFLAMSGPAGNSGTLLREVGLPGAVFMGLGSIVGTGLFLSLGIAAGVAGSAILLALPLAALLALANGLSSAQLAATHPVSGGTYEYGYRFLSPGLGFTAGLMFLLAKGASAATAGLGVGGAVLLLLGDGAPDGWLLVTLGAGAVLLLTLLVGGGIRRSNLANLVIVGITLLLFAWFLVSGTITATGTAESGVGLEGLWTDAGDVGAGALFHATALLFVAFTGYGRIATLGEEVKEPRRTIPRAIWATLTVVTILYIGVAAVALAVLGPEGFARATDETSAPLQVVAEAMGSTTLAAAMGIAAITAMAGVLLNLILGLSRVALAMGRRGDLPRALGKVHVASGSPRVAVGVVGAAILLMVLLGDVRATWSFSAFTVLIYYGITNLAALRLSSEQRLYPRWVAVAGLLSCFFLAFQVEARYWAMGLGLLAVGHLGRLAFRKMG